MRGIINSDLKIDRYYHENALVPDASAKVCSIRLIIILLVR